ncbi:MAG: NAD(P)/FAD-dependent oxidoreductase [Sedimentitalea sp.]
MYVDTIILGAGAAGLMCAATLGENCVLIDHARAPGEKIRISGGGRCNFTNLYTSPENFLSQNPHFAKSALARYTQYDFLEMVDRHGIAWHEKTLGQLFCDTSAREIIAMLRAELKTAQLWLSTHVRELEKSENGFRLVVEREGARQTLTCRHLVLATGGKSIPKMGATGFAYDVARQFNIPVTPTQPALVPLTFADQRFKPLAGVALDVRAQCHDTSFDEALLFTHRGLSGPAILQISSYWQLGETIHVNLNPTGTLYDTLRALKQTQGRRALKTELARHLPQRLVDHLGQHHPLTARLADHSDAQLKSLCDALSHWPLTPDGSEGYRTAEVTLGGIDTAALSSRSMECTSVPGLYAIGEAVDVTGWLGGYNFQWAWSSGWAAATAITKTRRAAPSSC